MTQPSESAKQLEGKILRYLQDKGPATCGVLVKALFSHPYPVSGVLKRLVREGRATKSDTEPAVYNLHPTDRLVAEHATRDESPMPAPPTEIEVLRSELYALHKEFVRVATAQSEAIVKLQADVAELEYRTAPRETRG
jgi:hypothetical protein